MTYPVWFAWLAASWLVGVSAAYLLNRSARP